jgi:general secretion pathway protein I
VITTLWGLHSKTVVLNLNSQFDTQAPFLAEVRLAQILAQKKLENDTEEEGDFGEEFPGYIWKSSVRKVESETLGALADKMKKIEISVNFNEDEFNYTMVSYQFIQE